MNFLSVPSVDNRKVLATLDDLQDDQPRKRRRLDNLSTEERILRRKLKNRVAAQTARDRKKARMQELEEIVAELEKENKLLKKNNEDLGKQMTLLSKENAALKVRLGVTPPPSPVNTDHQYAATAIEIQVPEQPLNSVQSNGKPIVIKKEGAPSEHASLSFSLQKKARVLLLSLIIMWLRNPMHLTVFMARNAKQLKSFPQWKRLHHVLSKLKNAPPQKLSKLLRNLCIKLNLDQYHLHRVVVASQLTSSHSAKISAAWWGKRPLMKCFLPRSF